MEDKKSSKNVFRQHARARDFRVFKSNVLQLKSQIYVTSLYHYRTRSTSDYNLLYVRVDRNRQTNRNRANNQTNRHRTSKTDRLVGLVGRLGIVWSYIKCVLVFFTRKYVSRWLYRNCEHIKFCRYSKNTINVIQIELRSKSFFFKTMVYRCFVDNKITKHDTLIRRFFIFFFRPFDDFSSRKSAPILSCITCTSFPATNVSQKARALAIPISNKTLHSKFWTKPETNR